MNCKLKKFKKKKKIKKFGLEDALAERQLFVII